MFKKILKMLQNTFIATFSYSFTVLAILLLIANNGNILTDGSTNKRERERCQREFL